MLRVFITLLLISIGQTCFSQSVEEELVTLAKIYRSYHFSNSPSPQVFDKLSAIKNEELKRSASFIKELIKTNNAIATKPYLTKPDLNTLKNLFIIRSINWNLRESEPMDNVTLIDSMRSNNTSQQELLACYYDMLFISVGNKNKPLDMATTSIDLDEYGLKDDTEKGILFLMGMNKLGRFIWGYMNIVKPPNYKKALSTINTYPMFNSEPYYQFQYLNFPDFELTIDKREPKKSFKDYYINRYLETLLYHTQCLSQKKRFKSQREKVLLGSILKNDSYYQYAKNPEVYQKLFKRINR